MRKTPSYRERPGYNQALVTLTDSATGRRRDYWLGQRGSPESREAYHRLIAEWEANGRRLPDKLVSLGVPSDEVGSVTIISIIRAYWGWAREYYRPDEATAIKAVLRLLKKYFGSIPVEQFGPKKLQVLRDEMVRGDPFADPPRKPWSRVYINQQTRRIRQMFKWAASQELLPASVLHALQTLPPLKRGRCGAPDRDPVRPVPLDAVEQVKPFFNRQVRALVELQLLTAARPGELLALRACDIDTTEAGGLWVYRPRDHKNAHRQIERTIYFGPQARAILGPFMADRPLDAFLFSPIEAELERRARVHRGRRTPMSCGNRPGTNRVNEPAKQPGDRFTTGSYRRAIERACDQAFPPPEHLRQTVGESGRIETELELFARLSPNERAELAAWRKNHRWRPNQLRHAAGTKIRREFGLEAAQLVLGHSSAVITDAVYAQRDLTKVAEVIKKVG